MAWEKSSAELINLFRRIAPTGSNIQHKPMFGYVCAFVNGKMFTGLFRQSMVFRMSPSDAAAFLDHPGTADFEPMPGRKMKGFVLLLDPFAAGEEEISDWMKCSLEFISRMAPGKKAGGKRVARK